MAHPVHPVRSCGTCRHFEPSSVLGEGWCRNPRLFGPQHSHRVNQDELDCSHGIGDYWEPAVAANAGGGKAPPSRPAETGDDAVTAGPRDPFSSEDMERPARGGGAPRGRGPEGGRPISQPSQERYWTDYLRVALPVLGLLLLIGLLWYWASAIIGNGTAEAPKTPVVIANVTPIEPATPPPAAETPPPAIQPTPGLPAPTVPPAIIPPTQPAAAQPTPAPAAPTEPPAQPEPGVDPANPCSGLPVYDVGATVSTTEEVNLRDQPSTEGQRLRVLPQGSLLTITGPFVESGQCDWWPVTVNDSGEAGFVIEQFIRQEAG